MLLAGRFLLSMRFCLLLAWPLLSAGPALAADPPGEPAGAPLPTAGGMVVLGWAERALVFPAGLEFRAKLDSGARTSSVHTTRIREFRRNGQSWVDFTLDNGLGQTADLELPVERFVRIREHGGSYQRRPVVKMEICVDSVYKRAEVNLVDREGFNYPLLIGRTYLKGDILVDSGVTKTRAPLCPAPGGGGEPERAT
jgi:hypothetical protein